MTAASLGRPAVSGTRLIRDSEILTKEVALEHSHQINSKILVQDFFRHQYVLMTRTTPRPPRALASSSSSPRPPHNMNDTLHDPITPSPPQQMHPRIFFARTLLELLVDFSPSMSYVLRLPTASLWRITKSTQSCTPQLVMHPLPICIVAG